MSNSISLDQLPASVEHLMRSAWADHEDVVLEQNGRPVAMVLSIEDYTRLRHHAEVSENYSNDVNGDLAVTEQEKIVAAAAYTLPDDLLADYHRLVDKQFRYGLTVEEESELKAVGSKLDEADLYSPLGQTIIQKAEHKHVLWMATLEEVAAQLHRLRQSL